MRESFRERLEVAAAESKSPIYPVFTWSDVRVRFRNWWAGAFGRRAAFREGGEIAFDNAAMKASDMGRPDIRDAINEMKARWTR